MINRAEYQLIYLYIFFFCNLPQRLQRRRPSIPPFQSELFRQYFEMDVAWYCLSPWSHDLRPLFPRYPVKCSVSPSEISSLAKSCWPTRETNRIATPRCERRHRFLRDTIRGHLTRRRKPPSKIHNVRLCVLNQYPPGSDSQWPVPSNGITVALPFGHRSEFSSTYTTFPPAYVFFYQSSTLLAAI